MSGESIRVDAKCKELVEKYFELKYNSDPKAPPSTIQREMKKKLEEIEDIDIGTYFALLERYQVD